MNKESEQPTILQWHREAAAELANGWNWVTGDDIAAIIARHDSQQHAATLRLLASAERYVPGNAVTTEWQTKPVDECRLLDQIRAHLAAHQMKGNQ